MQRKFSEERLKLALHEKVAAEVILEYLMILRWNIYDRVK